MAKNTRAAARQAARQSIQSGTASKQQVRNDLRNAGVKGSTRQRILSTMPSPTGANVPQATAPSSNYIYDPSQRAPQNATEITSDSLRLPNPGRLYDLKQFTNNNAITDQSVADMLKVGSEKDVYSNILAAYGGNLDTSQPKTNIDGSVLTNMSRYFNQNPIGNQVYSTMLDTGLSPKYAQAGVTNFKQNYAPNIGPLLDKRINMDSQGLSTSNVDFQGQDETPSAYTAPQAATQSPALDLKNNRLGMSIRQLGENGISRSEYNDLLDAGFSGQQITRRLDSINDRLLSKDQSGIQLNSGAYNQLARDYSRRLSRTPSLGLGKDFDLALGTAGLGGGKLANYLRGDLQNPYRQSLSGGMSISPRGKSVIKNWGRLNKYQVPSRLRGTTASSGDADPGGATGNTSSTANFSAPGSPASSSTAASQTATPQTAAQQLPATTSSQTTPVMPSDPSSIYAGAASWRRNKNKRSGSGGLGRFNTQSNAKKYTTAPSVKIY